MYAYDHTPVDSKTAGPAVRTPDLTLESLTIDVGYDNERLPIRVFPANTRPPYPAVAFYPSARVNTMPPSENLRDLNFLDYVIKSGRLVIYPIYAGTYERLHNRKLPGAIDGL